MRVPILSGTYTSEVGDYRASYPRNMMPIPAAVGTLTEGYLRPADGIVPLATGPGTDRGGVNWQGKMYRVMGTKLCLVSASGTVTVLGDVGPPMGADGAGTLVTMDYGFDRLAIWSGGRLYYWNGTLLTQVTDPDLGTVIDGKWISGYYMSTDGTYLIVTDLSDPYSVNPTRYGSAESDPDPILAVDELRNEAYAFGRYTIEVFANVGGDNFPFARIPGALVPRGIVGSRTYCPLLGSFAFVGSSRDESLGVYIMTPGDSTKISTREIDLLLARYSEATLSNIKVESRSDRAQQMMLIHLPDRTLVYDAAASTALQTQIWFTLDSGVATASRYRAQNLVRCYDRWLVGDPLSNRIGFLTDATSTHYGLSVGWEFSTQILYNQGNAAIIHDVELVCLPGRTALGEFPTVWTSYSVDGETWSEEWPKLCGKQGERTKRLAWRRQGKISNWRVQKFRGNSDSHLSVARLEMSIEPLFTKARDGR